MDESLSPLAAAAGPADATPRTLRIEFTGSGSEYFRIWIVNLLLSLVTLGLYLPFAKARRLRYFCANTRVDGHALSFHGDPWRMFRGFVLLAVLAGAYALAKHLSMVAGMVAFAVLAALWPALWRSSLRFRMGNTSWRGLRMSFRGTLFGAYKAMLPIYLPALCFLTPQALLDPEHPEQNLAAVHTAMTIFGVGFAAMLLLYPWGLALLKRYQHGGYAIASQRARLEVPTRRFYGFCLKGVLMYVGSLVALMALVALVAVVFGAAHWRNMDGGQARTFGVWIAIAFGLVYVLLLALIAPWFAARLQNLVWSGTHSAELRFDSRLRVRELAGLTVANWLLTAVTLGLYRPFAAVATARLRLQAVSLTLDGDVDTWIAQENVSERDASGDAAGDFFGFDIGL